MSNHGDSESVRLDELVSRVQIVLGRVAALQAQLRDMAGDLMEFQCGAEELLDRLAEAQRDVPSDGRPARARLADREG